MVKIDQDYHITQRFGFSSGYPYTRDSHGIVWFSTPDGFFRYDPRDGTSRLPSQQMFQKPGLRAIYL